MGYRPGRPAKGEAVFPFLWKRPALNVVCLCRYPNRNPAQAAWLLPMVEAVRQTVITIATDREIDVVTTNSDGSPARRAFLLSRLGPGSVETILDPGIDVVTQRLAGARTWSLVP